MIQYKTISKEELIRKKKAGAKIIDVRSADAYNGWKEKRNPGVAI